MHDQEQIVEKKDENLAETSRNQIFCYVMNGIYKTKAIYFITIRNILLKCCISKLLISPENFIYSIYRKQKLRSLIYLYIEYSRVARLHETHLF